MNASFDVYLHREIQQIMFTTVEESKRLLELGLSEKSADMHYARMIMNWKGEKIERKFFSPRVGAPGSKQASYIVQNFEDYEIVPCWSFDGLVGIMPHHIVESGSEGQKKHLYGIRMSYMSAEHKWCFSYVTPLNENTLVNVYGDTRQEAAYRMVVWLIGSGNVPEEYLNKQQ